MYRSPMLAGLPSYEIRNFKVFFGNQYLPDARWSDFKDLGQGYGKDGNHVFFMGQIVENAHPFSFQIIGDTYAKDYQHVFRYGQIVEKLQSPCIQPPMNFNNGSMMMQPMNSIYPMHMDAPMCMPTNRVPMETPSYEIRDFKVFFGNQYLSDARWIDFTNLGQGYGKDIHRVFFMGHTIEDAHSFSFEVLNKGYARDKNHVFHNGQIVEGLRPFDFQVLQDFYTNQ